MYALKLCNLFFRVFVEMLTSQLKSTGGARAMSSNENRREEILRRAFPAAHSTPLKDVKEEQDGFHLVNYWTKKSYKEPKSGGNFPVKFLFMEDDIGNCITMERLDQIRSRLQSAFKEIRREDRTMLADSWLENKRDLIEHCYDELQQCFEEFNYCDGWKPRQFMVHWYSNFICNRSSRKNGHGEVKHESDDDNGDNTILVPSKRPAIPNARPAPKKIKKEKDTNNDDILMIIDPLSALFDAVAICSLLLTDLQQLWVYMLLWQQRRTTAASQRWPTFHQLPYKQILA
jgi:hypothetical protein